MPSYLLENKYLLAVLIAWILPWKGYALWKAARKNHRGWFIALLLTNTLALLEAAYIFHFSEPRTKQEVETNNT